MKFWNIEKFLFGAINPAEIVNVHVKPSDVFSFKKLSTVIAKVPSFYVVALW